MKNRRLIEVLEERGISLDNMVKSGMELFVPHGRLKSKKRASNIFREMLVSALEDINVSALVMAGLHLEDDGSQGLIPGLDIKDFKKRCSEHLGRRNPGNGHRRIYRRYKGEV
ncbi:MAG: hypothetical protein V3V63_00325 [Candidatus Hydrothermarchaeaceae archaeon]